MPPTAGVELADEIEQVGGGGGEVRAQLGDLVAQPVHLGHGLRGVIDGERGAIHIGIVLPVMKRLSTRVFGPPVSPYAPRSQDDQ
jgi:hypothetical protein